MGEKIVVGIYKDTTNNFTKSECDADNVCYVELPEKIVREWYEENKGSFAAEKTFATTGKPVEECTFDDWSNMYTLDDTEGLWQFAIDRGAEPLICSGDERDDEIILHDGTTVFVNAGWVTEHISQMIIDAGMDASAYGEISKDPHLPIKLLKAALERKPRSRIRTNGSMAHVMAVVDGCMPEVRPGERTDVLKEVFTSIKTVLYEMGESDLNSYFGTTEIGIVLNQDPEQVIKAAAMFRDDKNKAKVRDLADEIGFQNLYRIVCSMASDYCTLKKGET